ncbi:hypothetical protein [Mucilaginibacter psychrotolerans]|uniref:Uncharacterized protein n=1 Tax=Mucilaginibacter psychrotolerans TaxID=1524096 RepID=A0A4Y8SFS0_9SPHI|nr:hypothetical protein [Mucilaginibacter psychrotolerans]TFF37923.1 hypothetical protein E2R66_10055 [Mucilaginibacter psychrotolerans]
MYKYELSLWDTLKDKNGVPLSAKYFYGDEYSDQYLFHDPYSLPRFGHLTRKALMHYLGDYYNPHKGAMLHEPVIRLIIMGFIAYRIQHKTKAYDKDYIDNFLKKLIGDLYGVPLAYDQSRIDKGIVPPYRGILHDMDVATPQA